MSRIIEILIWMYIVLSLMGFACFIGMGNYILGIVGLIVFILLIIMVYLGDK